MTKATSVKDLEDSVGLTLSEIVSLSVSELYPLYEVAVDGEVDVFEYIQLYQEYRLLGGTVVPEADIALDPVSLLCSKAGSIPIARILEMSQEQLKQLAREAFSYTPLEYARLFKDWRKKQQAGLPPPEDGAAKPATVANNNEIDAPQDDNDKKMPALKSPPAVRRVSRSPKDAAAEGSFPENVESNKVDTSERASDDDSKKMTAPASCLRMTRQRSAQETRHESGQKAAHYSTSSKWNYDGKKMMATRTSPRSVASAKRSGRDESDTPDEFVSGGGKRVKMQEDLCPYEDCVLLHYPDMKAKLKSMGIESNQIVCLNHMKNPTAPTRAGLDGSVDEIRNTVRQTGQPFHAFAQRTLTYVKGDTLQAGKAL